MRWWHVHKFRLVTVRLGYYIELCRCGTRRTVGWASLRGGSR